MPKDFVSFIEYTPDEVTVLLDESEAMRSAFKCREVKQCLKGKTIALIWDAGGFRNRVAFELGISALGGSWVQVPGPLDERESIEDVAAYLTNWFDAIVARTRKHSHMSRLARAFTKPVINARTDYNHPCEVLGDLAHIRHHRGALDGLRVAFFGEATNLGHSWLEAAARQPISVVQCCPKGYEIDGDLAAATMDGADGTFLTTNDVENALRDAEVVYTDCWPTTATEQERERIEELFGPYCITAERLTLAARNVIFLPCPPVHRGEELSEDALTSPSCRVFEAKEYLLHSQNAVLQSLLGT
jgi:ornithine carbamoyltransferase